MTDAPRTCSSFHCRKEGGNLLACSRCKAAHYCSKQCQKLHWEIHKHKCVSPDVPRHEVRAFTIESIQSAIDAASPGDVVLLKKGTFESNDPKATLTINKPLRLLGPLRGMDKVKLNCKLFVAPSGSGADGDGGIIMADFEVSGSGIIDKNSYKAITLYNIRVKCPKEEEGDAFIINDCEGMRKGKCLLLDCEILGGSDGLMLAGQHGYDEKVHLKRTEVRFAKNRGIFANGSFIIEDCVVDMCGGYGIKGRCGWTEKGRENEIQPGPWSKDGPSGMGY